MGKYPVLSISMKNIDAADFDTAYEQACQIIRNEAVRADILIAGSDAIHPAERRALDRLLMDVINSGVKPRGLAPGM